MAYSRAVANRPVKVAGTWYDRGDTIDVSAIGDGYVEALVNLEKITLDTPAGDPAEITAAVDALIDGAPGTLDTLNEIAAAIGDDADFVTTVTAHATSDGSDHTFLDQDVTSGAAPVLDGTNFTNLPAGGATDIDGLSDAELDVPNTLLFLGAEVPVSRTTGYSNIAISSDGTAMDAVSSGFKNIAIGDGALGTTTSGENQIAIGHGAGPATVNRDNAIYIGNDTNLGKGSMVDVTVIGHAAKGDDYAVVVGARSGAGDYGVAVGTDAGYDQAGYQVAIGWRSGLNLTASGSHNTLVGYQSGGLLTAGASNTILGSDSDVDVNTRADTVVLGRGLTSGAEDGAIAIGSANVAGNIIRVESGVLTVGGSTVGGASDIDGLSDAGLDADSNLTLGGTVPGGASGATNNTIISGAGTGLSSVTSGDYNIAIGPGAGSVVTTKSQGVFIGTNTNPTGTGDGEAVVIGSNSVAGNLGVTLGSSSKSLSKGVSIGWYAGGGNGGAQTVSIGAGSGSGLNGGEDNVLVGYQAGNVASFSGDRNVVIGSDADLDTGTRNDAIVIGDTLTAGAEDGSIAIGSSNVTGNILRVESGVLTVGGSTVGGASDIDGLSDASRDGTTNYNLTLGSNSVGGTYNVAISADGLALSSATSAYNTAVGATSLSGVTTGSQNTAFGYKTATLLTTGWQNTFLGGRAGESATSGHYNVMVGFEAGESSNPTTTASNQTLVGRHAGLSTTTQRDNIVAIGFGALAGDEDGAIVIGSSAVTGNILRVESGVLTVGGNPVIKPVTAQTATANIAVTDHVITANHATVAITLTLPTLASAGTGREFIVKNIGAAVVTVDGNGTETIDGSADVALNQYESVTLVCNGTEWMIL